jgi:hypothetical protein
MNMQWQGLKLEDKCTQKKVEFEHYLKEECNKYIECQFVPCFHNFRAQLTPSEFVLNERILEALKGLAIHCLDSMEYVHHVGLDMGVLSGPK